jgi:hypothetical protein
MTYRVRHPELHQEDDIVSAGRIALAMLAMVAISAVLVVASVAATNARMDRHRPSGAFPERWLGPRHPVAGVREDIFEEHGGASLGGLSRATLDRYGWVDRDRRVVRIPIERAIDLVVAGRQP